MKTNKNSPLLLLVVSSTILGYTRSFILTIRKSSTKRNHSDRGGQSGRQPLSKHATAATSASPKLIEYNDFLPSPNPQYTAFDVVSVCMDTLIASSSSSSSNTSLGKNNHNSGLEVCFTFSSDRCRAAIGGNLEEFQMYAENPTFAFLVNCDTWRVVRMGPIIPKTLHRGNMQTILIQAVVVNSTTKSTTTMSTYPTQAAGSDDEQQQRLFLWTMQQERRPPMENCWMVHEVLYVKNAYLQTL